MLSPVPSAGDNFQPLWSGSATATRVRGISIRDIRFPTSLEKDGSDAMHIDPDYSCAYVILYTDSEIKGHGLSFTLGRGTELVVEAIKALAAIVVGKKLESVFGDMARFWRELTSESQLRWVGPEKGVIHLAVAGIMSAVWDLWARTESKPLWKLLVDMDPKTLVSTIDFRYITDVLTKDEAIKMLEDMKSGKEKREEEMKAMGYPCYTTQAGWLGYPDDKIQSTCKHFMNEGINDFKMKVGQNLEDDKRRAKILRDIIGPERKLMMDANQRWGVQESIDWMKELALYKPFWIEEPTSPDDALGHATISKALEPLGIGVATGEMCQNRVMFKQFLQAGGMQYCQVDACRLGGPNEMLVVYLMAKKFGVPVCPHAGGVGLCEMVQHTQLWDYICVSGTTENRTIEWVNHLHEHFLNPPMVKHGRYHAPIAPGYSTEMKNASLIAYEYPLGSVWKELFATGAFKDPNKGVPTLTEDRCFKLPG